MPDVESYGLQTTNNMEYVDYLRSIEDQRPEYREFRKYLEDNSKNLWYRPVAGLTGHVYLHDILVDNNFCPQLNFKAGENSDIQSLKNTLSNPPTGIRSRLILVGLDFEKTIDQRVLNLLRLNFNVEPLFFWSLLSLGRFPSRHQGLLRMSYMILKVLRSCPTTAGHVSTGKFLLLKRGIRA